MTVHLYYPMERGGTANDPQLKVVTPWAAGADLPEVGRQWHFAHIGRTLCARTAELKGDTYTVQCTDK